MRTGLARRSVNGTALLVLLGVFQTLGPLAIDMYLPALPALTESFGSTQADLQLTLSAFLVGFGGGQLFWGPLSDRCGRRWPMIAGSAIFFAASFGCTVAPNVGVFIVLRAVQGFGGCASAVLSSAMVRDLFDREEGSRARSLIQVVGSLAPLAAPLIGGQLLYWFEWQAIFVLQAIFGAIVVIGLCFTPESLPPSRRAEGGGGQIIWRYVRILRNRRFVGYMLCASATLAAMFAYISGTPFVYIEYFGVPPQLYGFLFGINIVGIILLSFVNRRTIHRLGSDLLLRIGIVIGGIAAAALLFTATTGFGGLAGIAVPIFFVVGSLGLITPNAIAGALADLPHDAGAGSALVGGLGMAFGGITGWFVGVLADGTPGPMAFVIAAVIVLAVATNFLLLPNPARSEP